VVQPRFGWFRGFLCAHGRLRRLPGPEAPVTANYETSEHDVLIIGAGGAGLRAAIEALAQGASVWSGLQIAPRKSSHGHG